MLRAYSKSRTIAIFSLTFSCSSADRFPIFLIKRLLFCSVGACKVFFHGWICHDPFAVLLLVFHHSDVIKDNIFGFLDQNFPLYEIIFFCCIKFFLDKLQIMVVHHSGVVWAWTTPSCRHPSMGGEIFTMVI